MISVGICATSTIVSRKVHRVYGVIGLCRHSALQDPESTSTIVSRKYNEYAVPSELSLKTREYMENDIRKALKKPLSVLCSIDETTDST